MPFLLLLSPAQAGGVGMRDNYIKSFDPTSPLRGRAELGDTVVSINGNAILDVLDYKFFAYDRELDVVLRRPDGSEYGVKVRKGEGGDLGLDFGSYLMDAPRSCANACVFCFIDQLPRGMRRTMYFKDDDARLSFLLGNYITLTNLSEREVERIIALHVSPINVSVHTTNPELRCKMLRNPRAGESLDVMHRFAEAGIVMNCQIVCCPGLNDGAELGRSMRELEALWPAVHSVSIVPVGLTRFREHLYPLAPFTPEHAAETVDLVEAFSEGCLRRHGSRIFFCGDELYLKAGRALPDEAFYEEFTQLENGVGMLRLLETEFCSALKLADAPDGRDFTIAAGGVPDAARPRLRHRKRLFRTQHQRHRPRHRRRPDRPAQGQGAGGAPADLAEHAAAAGDGFSGRRDPRGGERRPRPADLPGGVRRLRPVRRHVRHPAAAPSARAGGDGGAVLPLQSELSFTGRV